jgi:hypothetical protein
MTLPYVVLFTAAQQTADNSRDKMIRAESYIKLCDYLQLRPLSSRLLKCLAIKGMTLPYVVLFTAIGLLFLLRHLP